MMTMIEDDDDDTDGMLMMMVTMAIMKNGITTKQGILYNGKLTCIIPGLAMTTEGPISSN